MGTKIGSVEFFWKLQVIKTQPFPLAKILYYAILHVYIVHVHVEGNQAMYYWWGQTGITKGFISDALIIGSAIGIGPITA